MSKEFGENLRKLRKEKTGFSQGEMANQIGIRRSTYTYYETGKSEPNYATLKKLSDIIGVDYNKLLLYKKRPLDKDP